ncbi:MAG: lysophospholipid acyltransferase family protein [Rhizomicrobium sp.]|jgi:1-acyl-sn-glycerol-3-phosphate acyltransferase
MVLLRSAVYFLWFVLVTVVLNLGFLPALLLPRGVVCTGAQWWCRAQLWGLKTICGLGYEVRGSAPPPGVLVASKHMSMWDTLAMFVLLGDCVIVLKRELLLVPFYSWYALKLGFIFIDRNGKASALRKMAANAKAAMAEGRSVLIFPEGTRKRPGSAPDYKPGVAALYGQLAVPCVPIALNSALYWTGPSGFLKKPGTVIVRILPAIAPGLKRGEFMSTLQTRIESATTELLAEAHWKDTRLPAGMPTPAK